MKNNKYPYIIAEIGCNHNGDIQLAKKMIDEAKRCGCDAVKIQLWTSKELVTRDHMLELDNGDVILENVAEWKTKEHGLNNIFEQTDKYAISYDEHIEIFDYCRKIGIDYGSTGVTKEGIDFLVDQKVNFLKVASMDINNPDFVSHLLSKDIPVYISVGLASLAEIESIVNLITPEKRDNVVFLQCTSLYPPVESEVNLNFMKTMKKTFNIRVGYSDHTLGFSISLAAVALGAEVLEKHFTLDKNMPGWDHKVSADPVEMEIMCTESKRIVDSLGSYERILSEREINKRLKFRRSAVTIRYLSKGDKITFEDIVFKRPGTGIAPNEMKYLIGRILKHDIVTDKTLFWEDLV